MYKREWAVTTGGEMVQVKEEKEATGRLQPVELDRRHERHIKGGKKKREVFLQSDALDMETHF